jgi:Flp pilus assembly protein TadB
MSDLINIQCRDCKTDHQFTLEESRSFNRDHPFICTQCQIRRKENPSVRETIKSTLSNQRRKTKMGLEPPTGFGRHWKKLLGLGVMGCLITLGVVSKALLNPAVIRDLLIITPGLFVIWVLVSFTKITKKRKIKKKKDAFTNII